MGVNNSKGTKPKKSKKKAEGADGEEADDPKNLKRSKSKKKSKKKSKVEKDETKEEKGKTETHKEKQKDVSSDSEDEDDDGEDIPDMIVSKLSKAKVSKENFELLTVIGRGSFGKVMQVRKKGTNEIYAMKVMRKDAIIQKNQVTHTKDEKTILQKIEHPFIVKLHYAFQTPDKLYMILDYVNGGELFYHLKREGKFDVERVRFYAAEIASAIAHLHDLGVVYRDLKPENILIDRDGHICITDFGLSKEIPKDNKEGTHTFCGTPEYLAPEVLKGQGHGHAVDWWSLGTLIYEMLTGLPPFYNKNINVMYQKILTAQLTFPSFIDEDAQTLLEGLLNRDVDKRFSAKEVRHHAFFKQIDWEKLYRKEIKSPWKPDVKSDRDTSQIDEYFTNEDVVDSYVEKTALEMDETDADVFEGFTYGEDSNLK